MTQNTTNDEDVVPQTLEEMIKDLQQRVYRLEKSIVVKKEKWTTEEDNFLIHLATNNGLTQDMMRRRDTLFIRIVQAHQVKHARTERAITMRLQAKYFGKS